MANADYYITKNDTLPLIGITALYADGTAVNLTEGVYHLLITNADTGVTVDRTAALDGSDPTLGKLKYQWVAADSAIPGFYRAQFRVIFGSDSPLTFPNDDYILIQVYDGPVGQILTSRVDYQKIRDILGVETRNLSDLAIEAYIGPAESFIEDILAKQSGVSDIATIMAGADATAKADRVRLKAAAHFRVAYLYTIAATNAVDTSVTTSVGPISVVEDRGGIGAQWQTQGEEYLKQMDTMITGLTGFKRWRTL